MANTNEPLHLSVSHEDEGHVRFVTTVLEGELIVEMQRTWRGEWVTFGTASKAGSDVLFHRPE